VVLSDLYHLYSLARTILLFEIPDQMEGEYHFKIYTTIVVRFIIKDIDRAGDV